MARKEDSKLCYGAAVSCVRGDSCKCAWSVSEVPAHDIRRVCDLLRKLAMKDERIK